MPTIILGSASPRRAQLLGQLGLNFEVCSADIDETPRPSELATDYVLRMAREKAAAISVASSQLLLTSDTAVVHAGRILGKPVDRDDARQILTALSGDRHDVYTAIALRCGQFAASELIRTEVEFMTLSSDLIENYLETDEPWDKAGAYGIQGLAGSFVRRINGSVSNVIGLPLVETRELLASAGLETGVGLSVEPETEPKSELEVETSASADVGVGVGVGTGITAR